MSSTLRQILDGPRPVKKSRLLVSQLPWPEILPSPKPNNVIEIFGEMEFQESNSRFSPSLSTPPALLQEENRELDSRFCGRKMCLRCNAESGSRISDEFPAPISTIGKNGKPWLYYESVKKEGRFVLKEVRIPGQGGCMHSTRENGRLMLHLRNPNISDQG